MPSTPYPAMNYVHPASASIMQSQATPYTAVSVAQVRVKKGCNRYSYAQDIRELDGVEVLSLPDIGSFKDSIPSELIVDNKFSGRVQEALTGRFVNRVIV